MGKLFKRDATGTKKKAGGKVRGYIAEGADDRFCICIHGSTGPNDTYEYVLRIGDAEVAALKRGMEEYLRLGSEPLKTK